MSHCAGTGAGGKGPFNGHVKNTTTAKKQRLKRTFYRNKLAWKPVEERERDCSPNQQWMIMFAIADNSETRQCFPWKLLRFKNFLVCAIDTNLKLSFRLEWRKWLWELSWIIPNKMEMAVKYQFQFCYEKKIAFGAFEKVQTISQWDIWKCHKECASL